MVGVKFCDGDSHPIKLKELILIKTGIFGRITEGEKLTLYGTRPTHQVHHIKIRPLSGGWQDNALAVDRRYEAKSKR
jgi:hypothetical protein